MRGKRVIDWGVPSPHARGAGRSARSITHFGACILALCLAAPSRAADTHLASLADLTLEQLTQMEVTSVSRRAETLADAPASVYVVTADDIRRSGAATLPEALRLAPNLQVARADANQYVITARGFANILANKLLVMIDGRTIYSPLFSGVFWEAHDLVLPDVERIEVVSGPGGTLWGTNAVNGVINIVTRSARDTQGILAQARIGTDLRRASARYGGVAGSEVHYRVYGTGRKIDSSVRPNGVEVGDESDRLQAGFRADWSRGPSQLTVQGDAYRSDIDQAATTREIEGANLLARWIRQSGDGPRLQVLGYYDRTTRDQPGAVKDELNTFELEVQHGFRPLSRHDLVWGAGYRYQPDRVVNLTPAFAFIPPNRRLAIASLFAEDDVSLLDHLSLKIGARLEHNQYTRFEVLPNASLAWKPSPERLVWTSVARAVRAPSRIDREFFSPAAPPHALLAGGSRFESEISTVVEVGYRSQPAPSASYSITAWYGEWDRLRSLEPGPDGPEFRNGIHGRSRGVEAWGHIRPISWWRLSAGWSVQSGRLHADPGAAVISGTEALGNDPGQWWSIRSSTDLGRTAELDVIVRRVGRLALARVPSYTAVDARLGWTPVRQLEIAVVGRNLSDDPHPEWGSASARPEFEREGLVQLTLRL